MAQIVIIDGDKRQVEQLTIVQLPYEYLPGNVKQADITLADIRAAVDHVSLSVCLHETLEFAMEYDTAEKAREFLKGYDPARLAAKLQGIDYEQWLREEAEPELLKIGMEKVDEF